MKATAPHPGLERALDGLPGRLRRALRTFRRITGLAAVTSLGPYLPEAGEYLAIAPPVHPVCVRHLRSVRAAPCGWQWLSHLRACRGSTRVVSHVCPVGLRCAAVPVRLDGRLLGVAKLVVEPDTPEPAFKSALIVLQLAVSEACRACAHTVLTAEVQALRERLEVAQRLYGNGEWTAGGSGPTVAPAEPVQAGAGDGVLVDRALAYMRAHYREPDLSLPQVAAALRCNPKYLTSGFTKIMGIRMHAYLNSLRITYACRLLAGSDFSIKAIAYDSGFSDPARLARAFRRQVGVSPTEYRRIFSHT